MPDPAPILAALHWQYPQAAVAVVPGVLVLSAYVMWAYVPQVRQVGRAWAWALPGLRLTALIVLAVSLLRPAVTRPRTPAERGPVVVLVDDSRSMGVVDTGRPPGQRVALAAAMGRLPEGTRDAAAVSIETDAGKLVPLTDAVARARAEVGYARLAGRDTDAATARLDASVDALRQSAKALADAVAASGPGRTPRLDRLLGLLSTGPAGVDRETWLDRAGDRARSAAAEASDARADADGRLYDDDPAVHDAADAVADQTREGLAWAGAFDPAVGLVARLGPGVPTVAYAVGDLVTPIPAASGPIRPDATQSDLAGGVRGVLDRLTADPAAEPPRAVVLFSDGRQVGGGSVESVAAAAAGVPVHTVAIASRTPSPNVAVTDLNVPRAAYLGDAVTCRATVRPTAVSGTSTDVTFVAGDERQTRRVTFAGDRPVVVAFTWVPRSAGVTRVSVRAEPVPDEATEADNEDEGWTAVVGSPVRVAVFSPTTGVPADSARASLSAASTVRLTPVGEPLVEQVAGSDVVVLFDVTARALTPAQWEAVNQLVTDRGGGVILVPGDGGFGAGASPASPLGRLLPFAGPPPAPTTRPTGRFSASPDALSLADTPAESGRRWAALPPFDGSVLLAPLRVDARVLLSAGDVPVVVERPVGAGRVLCLASNQVWRWRAGPAGARDADRFWLSLAREAAGQPYAAGAGGVSLDTDAFSATPTQTVRLRLRSAEGAGARLRVLGSNGNVVRTLPFRPRGGGRFDLTLAGLATGDYTLEADAGAAGRPRVPLRVRPSADAEMADLSGDDNFLRRLSESTGGQSFRLDQLDAVAAQLSAPVPDGSRPIELPLWDGPYLYAGVLGLLTAEWALRRRAGLA